MEHKDLFKHGPLYQKRFKIIEDLKSLGLKNGDILYRASDAVGPLGIPFSRLVARITKSNYSHAAILFMEGEEIYVLEVNDQGTVKYRLLDWLDTCYDENFSIYRLRNITEEQENLLLIEIYNVLTADSDYDFTFSDDSKFYCTESVVKIYENSLNISIDPGYFIRDVVPLWLYFVLKAGSFLCSFFGPSLPFDKKLYFVGNKNRGMIASIFTEKIYEHC